MELSAKNAERMNKLLGMTEDDLKKPEPKKTTRQATSPKGLDPAKVAASIAAEHDWNEDLRAKKKLVQAYQIADAHDREENQYRPIADAISQSHDAAENTRAEGRSQRASVLADTLRRGLESGSLADWEKNSIANQLREEMTRRPETAEAYGQAGEWFDVQGIDPATMELYKNLYTAAHGNRVENAMLGIGTSVKGNLAAIPQSIAQDVSDWAKYIDQYEGDYWHDFFNKPMNEMREKQLAAGYAERPLDEDSYARRMYNIGQTYKGAATGGLSEDGLGDTRYFSPKWMAEQGISIAENAPNLALSAINPVLGSAYMVANAGGGRALELAEQGVGAGTAATRGLVSGGIEALTEKFSIDNWMDALTNNKGVLMNILGQMGVEASEESASYVLNYIADKAAKDPNAKFSWNELMDSAIGGAFSGGIYGGIGQIGRKGAEQAQRTLGENSRKNYEKAKEEDAGRTPDFDRQFDHYNKMGELGIEFDQIPEIASATPVSDAVKQGAYLTGKNDGVERATKLADRALQGETLTDAEIDSVLGHKETRQHFESAAGVKFSQSNAKNRTTVREYAEAEQKKPRLVKNDFSKEFGAETEDMLDRLAKRGGAQIEIVESLADGSNAVYENGSIRVSAAKLREDRAGALRSVVMHELTHHIETSGKHYDALKQTVYRHLERIGADAEQLKAAIEQEYRARGKELKADGAERELIAKYAEQVLSTEEAVQYLARENRGLFDAIREFIRDLVTRFKGTQDEQTMRKLLRTFDKALDTVGTNEGNRYQGEQHSTKDVVRAQDDITTRYQTEVDAVLSNTSSDTDAVLVGYTPTVLRNLGVPSLPLVVGRGHVYTMAKTEAEARAENRYVRRANYHGLGDEVVKNLYQYISNPVMVIASKDVSNKFPVRSQRSVVAIIDIGYSDESMLIPVEITAERGVNGEQMDVNVMSSAYTRGVQNLIEEAIAQENTGESGIFYIKNEAASKVAGRLQLPTQPTKATTSGIILHDVSEKVNLKIQDQTQTAQFTRWFGDWQNEPTDASKVVNADGTPKIVYHGTDGDFNVFQSERSAYWFSESEDYAESMMEERGGNEIKAVYLNIRRPYRAKLKPGQFSDPNYEAPILRKAREGGFDGVIIENDTANELEAETFYVVFKPEQIKSATDNVGTFDGANPDIRYSYGSSLDELMRQSGQVEAADRLRGMRKQYGTIERGERAARDISVPKKTDDTHKVSQTVRTILEATATPDALVPTLEEMTANGDFSYEVYTDKAAMADAEATVRDKGYRAALIDWSVGVAEGNVSKANTALGWTLYNAAANEGDVKTAVDVLNLMVQHQRSAAQAVQATRILKKLSPDGQLYGIQRSVHNLQEELQKKYGKKAPKLEISPKMAEDFLNARTDEERAEAERKLYMDIGRQMPSRFVDRWNAWRYLAMLGNARTHVRNVVGNAGFAPVVATKNVAATAIEAAVSRAAKMRGSSMNRTKKTVYGAAVTNVINKDKPLIIGGKSDRALLRAAWSDYDNVQVELMAGGKYSESAVRNDAIREGQHIFDNTGFKPWDKTVGLVLEKARRGNSAALEAEDMWFARPHYAYALAQYCKAQNISAEQLTEGRTLGSARSYAIREAQKATYRDTNDFSQAISDLGRYSGKNPMKKGISTVMEGILPFRKTPANILVRGVEYSPLGLLKGLTYDLVQVKRGNKTGAEAIDSIAAGLTGTGLLAAGVWLAASGLIRGSGGDDDKEKSFKELQGHQSYALELPGGESVTLDWLAPECLPFFVGVNLWEQKGSKNENATLSDFLQAISNVSEPMLEMSCLQSLNDLFDTLAGFKDSELAPLPRIVVSAATSYLTQGLPTIFGQIERSGEEERMTTYTEKNAFLTSDMQYLLGKASGKLPGDYAQIPYIDAWGRTEGNGSTLERALNNLLNPAYTSEIETSAMEDELLRLYNVIGSGVGKPIVLPSRAGKTISQNYTDYDLSGTEHVKYAKQKGQDSYKLLTDFIGSQIYKGLSDEIRAEVVGEIYSYANQIASAAVWKEYKLDSKVSKAQEAEKKHGISPATYLSLYVQKNDIESFKEKKANKDGEHETIANSKDLQIMQLVYDTKGLNDSQRKALFEYFDISTKIRKYNKARVNEELAKMRKHAK